MGRPIQLEFMTHGGRRRGAGRPPSDKVSHGARPVFIKSLPAHVTLRAEGDVPNMRSSRRFRVIRDCFAASRGRLGMRLIEFSVLDNHLHFIVEAESSTALARGMKGLLVRIARALNREVDRVGRVFADHYHLHLLRTPTEVVNCIRYVQNNAHRHYGIIGRDDCSSTSHDAREVLAFPLGWLLYTGWKLGRGSLAIETLGGYPAHAGPLTSSA
jgi:putative transposase